MRTIPQLKKTEFCKKPKSTKKAKTKIPLLCRVDSHVFRLEFNAKMFVDENVVSIRFQLHTKCCGNYTEKKVGKKSHPKKAFSIFRTIGTICSFFNPE